MLQDVIVFVLFKSSSSPNVFSSCQGAVSYSAQHSVFKWGLGQHWWGKGLEEHFAPERGCLKHWKWKVKINNHFSEEKKSRWRISPAVEYINLCGHLNRWLLKGCDYSYHVLRYHYVPGIYSQSLASSSQIFKINALLNLSFANNETKVQKEEPVCLKSEPGFEPKPTWLSSNCCGEQNPDSEQNVRRL